MLIYNGCVKSYSAKYVRNHSLRRYSLICDWLLPSTGLKSHSRLRWSCKPINVPKSHSRRSFQLLTWCSHSSSDISHARITKSPTKYLSAPRGTLWVLFVCPISKVLGGALTSIFAHWFIFGWCVGILRKGGIARRLNRVLLLENVSRSIKKPKMSWKQWIYVLQSREYILLVTAWIK